MNRPHSLLHVNETIYLNSMRVRAEVAVSLIDKSTRDVKLPKQTSSYRHNVTHVITRYISAPFHQLHNTFHPQTNLNQLLTDLHMSGVLGCHHHLHGSGVYLTI